MPKSVTHYLALLGVGLVVVGQWLWFHYPLTTRQGGIPVLIGLVLLIRAIRPANTVLDLQKLTFSVTDHVLTSKIPFALLGMALCGYTSWHAVQEDAVVWDLLILWAISIGLTIYGLVPHDAAKRWLAVLSISLRTEWRIWVLVGLLFGIGLLFRVVNLEGYPYILAGDEAQFAYEAVSVKDGLHWVYNPFQMGIWHHPRTYHTLMAVFIDVMGQTKAAARMPSATLGALTIPAVYLMGRRLFDRRVGLLAAIFIMSMPVHIQFSRTGMDQTGDPLFAALAFAFLIRALRDADRMEAALAGLTMGLSQYFYFAGRIIPLLLLVLVGLYALVNWRAMRHRIGTLLVTLIVAVVVVFPNLYASYMDKERSLSPRLGQVSIWATGNVEAAAQRDELKEYWIHQIRHAYMAYNQVLDESDVYGRYTPVLGWFAGVPMLIGLAVVLRHWRDPRFIILAVWIVGTATLGGLMLVDPPHYPRYVSATPALAVLVALGIMWLSTILRNIVDSKEALVRRFPPHLTAHLPLILSVALVVLLSLADQVTYFVDYTPRKLLYGETTQELNEVADVLDSFHGQYHVILFPSLELDIVGTDLLRYLTPDNIGPEFTDDLEKLPDILETKGPHAFVIAPGRFDEVAGRLMFEIPNGEMREYINERTGNPLLFVYFVDIP